MKKIYITEGIYNKILKLLGKKKPELGGMLGWTDDQDCIDTFVFDQFAKVGDAEYNPNTEYLMKIMNSEWEKKGIYLAGFVHSHPRDCNQLSYADVEYAQRIMVAFDLNYIFMPIVTSSYEYKTTFNPYIVTIEGRIEKCCVEIEKKKDPELPTISAEKISEIEKVFDSMRGVNPVDQPDIAGPQQESTFSRITSVIDVDYMSKCTIIGIGCGGSRGFYEDMARVGVGNFYLIDGDKSSRSNIASQNGFISEIGKFKPEVVKNRILDINENAKVEAFNFMLDDSITDKWLEDKIFNKVSPLQTIICAFTDSFWAQARAQDLAIKYKIPYLAAQHHEYGLTSEVIYWYPGISKYTAKDILKDRYDSYSKGYKNTVTSNGSPIFNTTRLNALCEKLATGILLFEKEKEGKSHYSNFIKFNSNRNLLLIRQKELNYSDSSLEGLFSDDDSTFFDDTIWLDWMSKY